MTVFESTLDNSMAVNMAPEKTPAPELSVPETFIVERLDETAAREALAKTAIHGDNWQEHTLTTAELAAAGLEPRLRMKFQDTEVWLSSTVYNLGHDRVAVVAYVKLEPTEPNAEPSYVARSFYRSNSQGLWRYLPQYLTRNNKLAWYDKGWGEASITLPAAIQQMLAQMSTAEAPVQPVPNPEQIFVGTARDSYDLMEVTYSREVVRRPKQLDGNFYRRPRLEDPDEYDRVAPESIKFNDKLQGPNFNKPLAEWQQYSPLYQGDITIKVYPSYDEQRYYLMCKDKLGRCWMGGVEDISAITSTGLHQQWIDAGDLTTPAFEYREQANGYGDLDLSNGNYVDMFNNYLRRIPVIKEYAAREAITDATTIDELLAGIKLVGGLQGTVDFFTDTKLKGLIDQIKNKEANLDSLPRLYGFRKKVIELLSENRYI